jgi:hypothetical protein
VGVVMAAPSPEGTHNVTEDAPNAEPVAPRSTIPTAASNNAKRLMDLASLVIIVETLNA